MASRYYGGGYGLVPQALSDVNENIYRMLGDYRKSKEDERAHALAMQKMDLAGEAQKTSGLESLGTLGLRKQQNENQRTYQEGMLGLQGQEQALNERKWDEQAPLREAQMDADRARATASRASASTQGILGQRYQAELNKEQIAEQRRNKLYKPEELTELGIPQWLIPFAQQISGGKALPGYAWEASVDGLKKDPALQYSMILPGLADGLDKSMKIAQDPTASPQDREAAMQQSGQLIYGIDTIEKMLTQKGAVGKEDIENLVKLYVENAGFSKAADEIFTPEVKEAMRATIDEMAGIAASDDTHPAQRVNRLRQAAENAVKASEGMQVFNQFEEQYGADKANALKERLATRSAGEDPFAILNDALKTGKIPPAKGVK